ncbi:DUF899 family protein [Amycolatopsis australiensis]|uniref:Uncharacterized protein n=1 Tax=Amycolatopsis australiensis TaxID=546364 RepID=A0A1K1RJJ4_9PSEU|nr:DUF899 family protein [Amycolatopsis australiensis]SFW72240.1 protein of unknown function [Amycolatopsis australiensis]
MTKLTVPELDRPRIVTAADYLFEGPRGRISLADLFDGRARLAVHHTTPDHDGPLGDVPAADVAAALHDPDLRLVLVSRAPYARLARYRRHFGRGLATYSARRAFTADFPVSRRLAGTGGDCRDDLEAALGFFRLEQGRVLHTGSVALSRLDFLSLLGVPDRLGSADGRR